MAERRFPVLMYWNERRNFPDCPTDVPWGLLEPHEQQAMRNHDQTLEELARRGGLGPHEMVMVLRDWPWDHQPETQADVDFIKAAVAKWGGESNG